MNVLEITNRCQLIRTRNEEAIANTDCINDKFLNCGVPLFFSIKTNDVSSSDKLIFTRNVNPLAKEDKLLEQSAITYERDYNQPVSEDAVKLINAAFLKWGITLKLEILPMENFKEEIIFTFYLSPELIGVTV